AQPFLNETGGSLDLRATIGELEQEMVVAANNLEFEKAALLRDQVRELKRAMDGTKAATGTSTASSEPVSYLKSARGNSSKRPGRKAPQSVSEKSSPSPPLEERAGERRPF